MQKIIYYLFALLIMLNLNESIIAQGVDPGTKNLKHSWTFNDGTANDYVGGANGTLMGGAQVTDGSLFLNSLNQWMEMPPAKIAINTYSEITIEAWFSPFQGANTSFHMLAFFGNSQNSVGTDYYFFTAARGDDKSRAAISIGVLVSPWTGESGADGPELDDGELHHMVSTLSATDITLYIDGELKARTPLSATNKISAISTQYAYLAKGGFTVDPTWQGEILEFNIYNKVLSADEVPFLFNKGATVTRVEDMITMMPKEYNLLQNYPNPFNPITVISYQLPVTSNVSLKVYNLLGQEVAILFEGIRQPGNYQATFEGSKLASGVYLYRMTADNFVETKKLVLLK